MAYKIEKGVPLNDKWSNRNTYPFSEMDVGDSFVCESVGVRSTASVWGFRHGKKFAVRKEGDKYRVWRVK